MTSDAYSPTLVMVLSTTVVLAAVQVDVAQWATLRSWLVVS